VKRKLIAVFTVLMMLFSMFNATSLVFAQAEGNDPEPSGPYDYYTKFEPEGGQNQSQSGITVKFGDKEDNEYKTVSWTATDDIQVLYVFVKAGSSQSNENGENGVWYTYTNESGGTGLVAPEGRGISHVSFYYVDAAKLKIQKVLQGEQIADDEHGFNISIKKGSEIYKTCTLSNGDEAEFKLPLGTYSVEEEQPGGLYSLVGYTLDAASSNGTVVLDQKGQTKILVVTNLKDNVEEPTTGTITIQKVVQKNTEADGWISVGNDTVFYVNVFSVPGGVKQNASPIEVTAGQNATLSDLSFGTYNVIEVTPTSEYAIYDSEDDEYFDAVTLTSENPNATATIVNRITPITEEKGTVTIIKELVNEKGEPILTSEKSFKIKLTDSKDKATVYSVPVGVPHTSLSLSLGAYKVEEVEIPSGYEYVSISNQSFNLTKDGFTITVKNKKLKDGPPPQDPKGTIIIKKVILDKNEHVNTTETREFIVRVRKIGTDNYVDFTLKNGALEKSGQFDLGEYEIGELNLLPEYNVQFSLSSNSDADGNVELNNDGDIVTVTVTNMQKDISLIPTVSKDDGGVRVYPGDTITYQISVDPKDYNLNNGYLLESPDPNTEYIGGNEWTYLGIGEDGRKIYKHNLYSSTQMFARSGISSIPGIPEFKVKVKESTPNAVELVTNFVSLYYNNEGSEHVTAKDDTPILHRNNNDDDDNDDVDKDDEKKDDPPKTGKPDLVVAKTDNNAIASLGSLVEYVITVENKGDSYAEGVKVYETLPAGAEFAAASNQGWVLEDGKYVHNIGLMNVGDKKEVKFVLKVSIPFPTGIDKILNNVEVKDNGTETATNDNKASDDTPILIAVPVVAVPPVVIPPTPTPEPVLVEVVIPPAPQVPDLPFTGGPVEVELIFAGMGILLMVGGMTLKKRR
jgi:uncharacterized repeat protein (TIGR01451 family)